MSGTNSRGGNYLIEIILASHGELSKGMYNTANMIAGEDAMENVSYYCLYPGENANEYAEKMLEELTKDNQKKMLIVTDLYGGSVHTAFTRLLITERVMLFSGMNINLVLELILNTDELTDMKIAAIVESSREGLGMLKYSDMTINNIEEDF